MTYSDSYSNWKPLMAVSRIIVSSWISRELVYLLLDKVRPLNSILYIYKTATWENAPTDMCATEDSNQHAYPPSLIRVFIVCMKKLCILSYLLSRMHQRRFRSDCANAQSDLNLRWLHMSEGTAPHIAAYIWNTTLIKRPYAICGQGMTKSACTIPQSD